MAAWDELRSELGVALNEADLLGFEVDPDCRTAGATFRVLALPSEGLPPDDRRVQMVFRPVGRVAASLRNGRWDDESAEVTPFEVSDLLGIVQAFGGQPICGWKFFDVHESKLKRLRKRLSVDLRSGTDGLSHSITVFQCHDSRQPRHLDLVVWFDEVEVRRPDGAIIPLEEFAAGGIRWWDRLYAGDNRTEGHGIVPGAPDGGRPASD